MCIVLYCKTRCWACLAAFFGVFLLCTKLQHAIVIVTRRREHTIPALRHFTGYTKAAALYKLAYRIPDAVCLRSTRLIMTARLPLSLPGDDFDCATSLRPSFQKLVQIWAIDHSPMLVLSSKTNFFRVLASASWTKQPIFFRRRQRLAQKNFGGVGDCRVLGTSCRSSSLEHPNVSLYSCTYVISFEFAFIAVPLRAENAPVCGDPRL